MAATRVKICGLTAADHVAAAVEAGAAYVGFMFFPPSPRNLSVEEAVALGRGVPAQVTRVAVTVDPDDGLLDALTGAGAADMIQLHGSETPARVREVRQRTGLPVMKSVGVAVADDLAKIAAYAQAADRLLIDAKAPEDAVLPGGNGLRFDWRLLDGLEIPLPWMLAGGLTPENAAEAVRLTGATELDVSSGVEASPGQKDPAKMRAFIDSVAAL